MSGTPAQKLTPKKAAEIQFRECAGHKEDGDVVRCCHLGGRYVYIANDPKLGPSVVIHNPQAQPSTPRFHKALEQFHASVPVGGGLSEIFTYLWAHCEHWVLGRACFDDQPCSLGLAQIETGEV